MSRAAAGWPGTRCRPTQLRLIAPSLRTLPRPPHGARLCGARHRVADELVPLAVEQDGDRQRLHRMREVGARYHRVKLPIDAARDALDAPAPTEPAQVTACRLPVFLTHHHLTLLRHRS